MFNFTTTTLIHSADQFEANPNGTNQVLRVNGVNLFKKDNVVAVYRNRYVDPVNGKLKVKVPTTDVEATDRFRLKFYVRRSGDNNSYYSNDFVFKGKEFVYEWTGKQNSAAKVAKLINKIQRLYGDIYLKVYVDTEDNTKLVFEGDNYSLFTTASLEKWEDQEPDCCVYREPGHWTVIDEITEEDPFISTAVTNCSTEEGEDSIFLMTVTSAGEKPKLEITKCINGTGTYWQIMKDLRLPTMDPWNIVETQNEMPIPGNKYVQYTLHYISCRGVLGGAAVGEVTHSKTTHGFFVPADCCCEGLDGAFQKALKDAFGDDIIENAPHDDPTQQPKLQGVSGVSTDSDATFTARDTTDENADSGSSNG